MNKFDYNILDDLVTHLLYALQHKALKSNDYELVALVTKIIPLLVSLSSLVEKRINGFNSKD